MKSAETLAQLNLQCENPRLAIPDMNPWNMEFTALVRDLWLNSGGELGGFLPAIQYAASYYKPRKNSNHYAYSLYLTLHSLGNTMGFVAPIYDVGSGHWTSLYDGPFRASSDSAANMHLPFDMNERKEKYERLFTLATDNEVWTKKDVAAKKDPIVTYLETLAERQRKIDYMRPYGLEDWLYATLFLTLSDENLMKPLEFGERMSHIDFAIFGALEMVSNEQPTREAKEVTAADKRVEAVMENLDNNRYFLTLPYEVDVEPVIIERD